MRSEFYITGGTLPADARCYVERQADRDLLAALLDSQFCYVLDTRQVGKSSLIECTAQKLRERGVAVAKIDLTTTGKEVTAAQWYNGMLRQVADSLHTAGMPDFWDDLRGFWRENGELGPMQRWIEALRAIVLSHSNANLVIFVDEIESVRSFDFTDEFFAGIRACYNRRVDEPALRRLSFCLAGSATPDELIHSVTSTPFNIGRGITLSDFTPQEAAVLAAGLPDKSLLDRILYWTNGHPYLTQRLCAEITESASNDANSSLEHRNTRTPEHLNTHTVDALCHRLFFAPEARKSEKNLAFVAKRILESPLDRAGLLDLYGKVRRGSVVNDDKDALQSTLRLAGVARARNGQLEVRNRIYERVFDQSWIRENMPYAEVRRQRTTAWRVGLSIGGAATALLGTMGWLTFRAIRAENRANTNATLAQNKTREAIRSASEEKAETDRAERLLYISTMNLAQREYEAGNISNTLAILDDTRHSPYRSFEWGYWNRLCHLNLLTLQGHKDPVTSAAFSPDGKQIVTGSEDGTARVWDAKTGKTTLIYKGHAKGVISAVFSPDGKYIVTGSRDKTANVWDAKTGHEALTLKGHSADVMSVAFSSDGRHIATGSWDKTAKVWDAQTGRELSTMKGNTGKIRSVVFSPDGKQIVTGDDDATAKVWDVASGKLKITLVGHKNIRFQHTTLELFTTLRAGIAVAFSPDGRRIVTGSIDTTAKIWDAATGKEINTLKGHTDRIMSVVFSPDGRQISTGSEDATVKLWDVQTGNLIRTIKGDASSINSVAFSPDGKHIVTGSGSTAKIWDARVGGETITFKGHSGEVKSVAFSPDGEKVITGSYDETAKLWDANTAENIHTFNGRAMADAYAAFSPDGMKIVIESKNDAAKVWSAQTWQELLTLKGHISGIHSVAFSPDSMKIATGSYDNTAKVWDANTGKILCTFKGHSGSVRSIAFSPDGKRIATGSDDNTVKVWNAQTAKELFTLKGHTSGVNSLAFSPDGAKIATGSYDATAKIWDAQTGSVIRTLKGAEDIILSVTFSPDGKRLVASYGDDINGARGNLLRMWDVETSLEILTLKGLDANVNSVAFSPDGKKMVTGSKDYTAKVWLTKFD